MPPIALLDINHSNENMKLLITEWSKASEQFCHQFIEGSVDPRIAPKIAETLAVLNTIEDFDPSFNITSKPCVYWTCLIAHTYQGHRPLALRIIQMIERKFTVVVWEKRW